jgi:hypothetical protein
VESRTALPISDSEGFKRREATWQSAIMGRMKARSLAVLVAAALSLAGCGGGSDGGRAVRKPTVDRTVQGAGTYRYDTRGFERLSAIISSRHAYPHRSTITVSREGCGLSERWDVRPERWVESRFCLANDKWRLASFVDYHEFFGQPVLQRFTCRGPFVRRAPSVAKGFAWTDRCRGAGSRVTVRYEVVRRQSIAVAGRKVPTVLIRARARLRGQLDGFNTIYSWLSRRNGLLVRRSVQSRTALGTPFGKVSDRERYSLRLRSPAPG